MTIPAFESWSTTPKPGRVALVERILERYEARAEPGGALGIDARPQRLDLPDTGCRRARDAGLRFVVGTAAHRPEDPELMAAGVNVARRGWLERGDVLDTLGRERFAERIARR